jgi:hypothetical protein
MWPPLQSAKSRAGKMASGAKFEQYGNAGWHPSFKGLREDKDPRKVTIEWPTSP